MAFLCAAVLLCGCGADLRESQPQRFLIPWSNEKGGFELQEVEIRTLGDPYELSGAAASIYVEAPLTLKGFDGRIAKPQLIRSHSVWVPSDALSSLAVATYAHFERLMQMDQALGAADHLSWPRSVGLWTHLQNESGKRDHNNARYFGVMDSIAIVPYSLSKVPLAANGGVLAHEHFHAHFQKLVLEPIYELNHLQVAEAGERVDKLYDVQLSQEFSETGERDQGQPLGIYDYNWLVLRAWNEGLADFWGYAYSNDKSFMAGSFTGNLSETRQLDLRWQELPTSEVFQKSLLEAGTSQFGCQTRTCEAYTIGTSIARFLVAIADSDVWLSLNQAQASSLTKRKKMAGFIIERLPIVAQKIGPKLQTQRLSPDLLISLLFESNIRLGGKACDQLESLVSSSDGLATFNKACDQ